MKKVTSTVLGILLGMMGHAHATPVFIDVGAAPSQGVGSGGTPPIMGGDLDTFTSVFDQLALFADTTTIQYDSNGFAGLQAGDKFIDDGTASITSLLPPLLDEEGLGLLSELTISWTGLTGITTSDLTPIGIAGDVVQTIEYDTTNTTFSFYFHGDAGGPDGPPDGDFGGSIGVGDNTGFTNGEKVLEIAITGGSGTNTFDAGLGFISGSSVLNGEIIFAKEDFWWFDNLDYIPGTPGDQDFADLLGLVVPITLTSKIDQNTDEVLTDTSVAGAPGPAGFGTALFAVHSTHDGSLNFTLPEPGTLLLFGLGLLAITGFRRSIFPFKRV